MSTKYSPIVAMLLLAGAEAAAPSAARSEQAHAAPLSSEAVVPRVLCFMGLTSDRPSSVRKSSELYRSWYCMPEEPPALTH